MQDLLQTLTRLGPARLIAIGLTLIGFLAFMGFFVEKMTKPEMSVLFADLEPADAGSVLTRLETMGVRVETGGGGSVIMAPVGEIPRLRMLLAQDGLPAGGAVGYELLDRSNGLGATSFAQQMSRLRALEGELARSVRTLSSVRQARVHLVLPKRELFSREELVPTASIVVAIRGPEMSPGQVAAIRHMVAAAVPKLQANRVSIVDTAGNLLASGQPDTPTDSASASAQDAQNRKHEIEQRLAEAIERLLERATGPDRVRAEISAELDFDRITTNSEQFDPEGQVMRSSQVITEESQSNESSGTGNDNVTVDQNLPNQDGANPGSEEAGSQTARTEEVSNFEISKTVRTHIRESGLIRRLSVAVMVDAEAYQTEAGATAYRQRSPEQMATLESLAKSAVGYDEARGDVFQIASLEFARPETFFGDENQDAIKLGKEDYYRIGQMAGLFVVALLAILLVMRPAVTRALSARNADAANAASDVPALSYAVGPDGQPVLGADGQPMPALAAPQQIGPNGEPIGIESQESIDLENIRGGVSQAAVKKIGTLIDDFPEESVAVVRGWMEER